MSLTRGENRRQLVENQFRLQPVGPQVLRGVFDQLLLNIDLAPSLLELASLTPPPTMQGRSFLSLLGDTTAGWRSSVLLEYFYNRGQTARFPTWQAVRTEHWKLIHYPDFAGMDELYDLRSIMLEGFSGNPDEGFYVFSGDDLPSVKR